MKITEQNNKLKSEYKNIHFNTPVNEVSYIVTDGLESYYLSTWIEGEGFKLDFIKFGKDRFVFYKELELMDNRSNMLKESSDYIIDMKLSGKW
jgi:hypothetical protein